MDTPTQILVASSELENRRALAEILKKEGYDRICVSRASECKEVLETHNVGLVFCDRRLTDGSYRDVLAVARGSQGKVRVVVTSRLADWDEYLEALHHGAFDLIASPGRPTDVLWAILQARREEHEPASLLAAAESSSAASQRRHATA
jgi:DNA-binding NtrC family response regulator